MMKPYEYIGLTGVILVAPHFSELVGLITGLIWMVISLIFFFKGQ